MTNAQTAAYLANTAIAFLAEKHGRTVAQVTEALNAGNRKLTEQFAELIAAAIPAVA
jgi:hypothetical protein